MNYISPMELTTLLSKTKHNISNLTLAEKCFLSYLLANVNGSKIPEHGYLAWPGIDTIIEYTGLGDSTIQKLRKTLVKSGWMVYTPGKGPRNSNHYYLNAQKIIDCYVASGNVAPSKPAAKTNIEGKDGAKKEVKRNTSGLVQNVSKETTKSAGDGFPRWYKGVLVHSQNDIRKVDIEDVNLDCPF